MRKDNHQNSRVLVATIRNGILAHLPAPSSSEMKYPSSQISKISGRIKAAQHLIAWPYHDDDDGDDDDDDDGDDDDDDDDDDDETMHEKLGDQKKARLRIKTRRHQIQPFTHP